MATDKQTLVFVHGSGDSARVWEPLIALLPDVEAVAIDLPGHGALVDQPGPATMSVGDYAAFVGAEIERRGLSRPTLVGHSLGGAIAMRLALSTPDVAGRLVLVGTGARLRVSPTFLASAREADPMGDPLLTRTAFAEEHAEAASAYHAKRAPTAPGALYRDLSACDQFDVMAEVERISQPTLIVTGESDRMTPPKFAEFLHARLPNSALVVIPDAGHYVHIEQPERVAAAIGDWLARG